MTNSYHSLLIKEGFAELKNFPAIVSFSSQRLTECQDWYTVVNAILSQLDGKCWVCQIVFSLIAEKLRICFSEQRTFSHMFWDFSTSSDSSSGHPFIKPSPVECTAYSPMVRYWRWDASGKVMCCVHSLCACKPIIKSDLKTLWCSWWPGKQCFPTYSKPRVSMYSCELCPLQQNVF